MKVNVQYPACTDTECLLPKTESFTLKLDLDVIDIPDIGVHRGHGQRAGNYDGMPAVKRLLARKARAYPQGVPMYLAKVLWLQLKALGRKVSR